MKKIALLVVVFAAIGIAYAGYNIYTGSNEKISQRPNSQESENSTIVSAQAAEPKIKKTEVHSADGEANALLEEESGRYSLYSCDTSTCTNKLLLFQTTVPASEKIELPFNTWSPDNKLVFIVKKGGGMTNYMVFRADGAAFANGEKFMDVATIFAQKQPELSLIDVTGWDSDTLLHVHAAKDGKNGPSFWFEIPSGAVIQLAH